MEEEKRISVGEMSKDFRQAKNDFIALLSTECQESYDLVTEICRIVENGDLQQQSDLVAFLNYCCLGSPRRFRLLKYRMEGRTHTIWQRLLMQGFKVHNQQCCQKSEVLDLKRTLSLIAESLQKTTSLIEEKLKGNSETEL